MAAKRKPRIRRPPVLFARTQKVVARLEKHLGGPFLAYWNSVNGGVCQNDMPAMNQILQKLGPRDQLHLFIKSNGGDGQASLRLVHLLRQYTDRLCVLVPFECASAATMMALGADEIRMGNLAYLTAVDTSLTHDLSPVDVDNDRVPVGLDEVSRIIRLWREEAKETDVNPYQAIFQHIHPLVVGAVDRATSLSIMLCEEILAYHMKDQRKARRIAKHLNSAYPAHSYPVTIREAKKVGLNVEPLDPEVDALLVELNNLYSEMGQRARTDFDEFNHHDNEILNIVESRDILVFYQTDKDWYYRKEERRWCSINDKSQWRRIEKTNGKRAESVLHVR